MTSNCEKEKDFYRETWARYLGYVNEVGESFRAIVPLRVVQASYAIAFAYVFADAAEKGWKKYKDDGTPKSVLRETGDALLWQTLASVIIPGYLINRICFHSDTYLKKNYSRIPKTPRVLITVGAGLLAIPFIVHPIDDSVSLLMDLTYRKFK